MTRTLTPHKTGAARAAVLLVVAGLLGTACSSDAPKAAPGTTAQPTTNPTVAATQPPVITTPATEPATTEPATTGPIGTNAALPQLASLEPQIRDALAASLAPGFYTLADNPPPESLPSGASIGIRVPGQPDLLVGVGTEVNPAGAPFDPTAPFKPGEVTVNVLFALYDMLVDEGTVDPAVTLATWLPNYPNADQISAKMLRDGDYGGHGMADTNWVELITADFSRNWTIEEVLAEAAKAPPGAIGTKGNGDTAAMALDYIIEKSTGQTFADLITSRFAEPLGLKDTGILDPDHLPANFSHGRFNFNGTAHTTMDYPFNSFLSFNVAHAGLISTLTDQLTLVRAMATGKIPGLDRLPTPDKFKADHLLSDEQGDRYVGDQFPLNLHCPCKAVTGGFTGTAIGRRTNEDGSLTQWYYFPKSDVTIVIHNNSNEEATPLEVQNLVYEIYTTVTGDKISG